MPAKPLQNRRQLAALISDTYFPVTARQIQSWPELIARYVGRQALFDPDEALAAAKKRLDDAPVVVQGDFKMNRE